VKRILVTAAVVVVAFFGIDALADQTQNRSDRSQPGSTSEIVLSVEGRGRQQSPVYAAESLWGACRGTVEQSLVPPGPVEIAPGRVRLVTEPALGPHAWRRLRGCLEDATLDLVRARVVSKHDTMPGPTTATRSGEGRRGSG
jgi:hypothetical protein